MVVAVATGPEAIERVVKEPPDEVLLKAGLPHASGVTLAELLAEMPGTSLIPVARYDLKHLDTRGDRPSGGSAREPAGALTVALQALKEAARKSVKESIRFIRSPL